IRCGGAPTGSFPIENHQGRAGAARSNPGVLDGEVSVDQRSWETVAHSFDVVPFPFENMAVGNSRPEHSRVIVAEICAFDVFPNLFATAHEELAIIARTSIREAGGGRQGLA